MAEQDYDPVDRLNRGGTASGSSIDLLAVGFSRDDEKARTGHAMAREMAVRYDRLHGLMDADYQELAKLTGLDRFEILRALALMELGRRSALANRGALPEVDLPEDVFHQLAYLRREKREHFVAVLLDSKSKIIRIAPIHIGTVNMSIVGAREVFREAVREGAASIIVAHNHPSGDPTPSPEDIEVTAKLSEVGELLDIPLLDHIIIGYDHFVSFSRKGLLCKPTGTRS
jgi:DNA repair protein RadC